MLSMMEKDISANLYQKYMVLCSKILVDVSHIFVTMATYWVPDLPDIKGFTGHFWRSVLIFANGASSA